MNTATIAKMSSGSGKPRNWPQVSPSSATRQPRAAPGPPSASITLRPIARLRLSLTLTTASTIRVGLS